MLTAVTARVAEAALARAPMFEPPDAVMAETENAASVASDAPMLPEMLAGLAAMYARKVLIAPSMRSTVSFEVPQRGEWRFAAYLGSD